MLRTVSQYGLQTDWVQLSLFNPPYVTAWEALWATAWLPRAHRFEAVALSGR